MKNTFYYSWLLALLLIANNSFAQQSHLWSLPNQQLNMINFQLSPLPVSVNYAWPQGYDGRSAVNCHNSMHDENGDLLFFIVDGHIFNNQGEPIGDIYSLSSFPGTPLEGYNEVVIIPVPNQCNQFYIVTSEGIGYTGGNRPHYVLLDLSVVNLNYSTLGTLLPVYNTPATNLSIVGSASLIFNDLLNQSTGIAMAATPLRTDGTRFLFCSGLNGFVQYLVTDQGIFYQNHHFYPFSGQTFKGEAEVMELSNGNYKVAFTAPSHRPSFPNTAFSQVYLYEITPTGAIISEELISYDADINATIAVVKGLEFSPDANYLYLNHTGNLSYSAGIDIYDVSGSATLLPQTITGSGQFQTSQIETGYDGGLYVVNSNGLGKISNPNNPTSTMTFTPNQVPFSTPYDFTSFGGGVENQNYLLPDQIDGEDYLARYSQLCCKKIDGYEFDFIASVGFSTWNINGANPFNAVQEVRIDNELLFPSGSTVYINNMTFRFEPGARMTIAKGAKVYLNNTLLTSTDCDGTMWQGVSVDGNPNVWHINSNSSQHGFLNMVNNSEISNARIGVTLHKRDINGNAVWSNTGGLITASRSTFRNNGKDVEFLAYGFKNRSRFYDCTFITDNQLNDGTILAEHVSLFKVNGVIFKGCDFKNTTGYGQFYSDNQRGAGISSIEAYYKVLYRCASYVPSGQPCTNKDRGSFTGLYYGIYALGINGTNSIEVMYNDFINNTRGAYFGALDKVKFVNNTLDVGAPIVWSYGMYIENSTGYQIENNAFLTSASGNTYGLLVDNSNNNQTTIDGNEVYHNTFTDLYMGTVAFHGNVGRYNGGFGAVVQHSGLTYKCNTFSGSRRNDIAFMQGISLEQGACTNLGVFNAKAPANNVFSTTIPSNGDFWNYDQTLFGINQLYQTSYHAPNPNGNDNTTPQLVNAINTDINTCGMLPVFNRATHCPVNRFDVSGKKSLTGKINTFKQSIVATKSFLAQVDGEVQEEILEVQEEILEDGIDGFDDWEDFAEDLIDESPFVKDSHLVALFDLPIPGGVLKEILLANSPLPKTVLNVLDASPFSQNIKNQVNAAQTGGINGRVQKQNEIGYLQRESALYFNEIIREYIHDTTLVGGLDSAIVLLKGRNTDADACALVGYYIDTKQYVKAQEQLVFLRATDSVKYDSFCKFYELLLLFDQTVSNCYIVKTNPARKAQLEAFAAGNPKNKVCYKAQALLNEVYKFTYFEQEPVFPSVKSTFFNTEPAEKEIIASKMVIYPNPANDILTIELLLEREDIANVTLYDAMGRVALNKQITNLKSYMDVSVLENGIYILIVELPNGEKLTDKIIVRK